MVYCILRILNNNALLAEEKGDGSERILLGKGIGFGKRAGDEVTIYSRFKMAIRQTAVANTESVVESAVDRLEADLLNVRQISNAVNYNIIQEYDISSQEFERQFSLLYEINTDKIQSMALYDNEGNLVAAEPLVNEKADAGAAQQDIKNGTV